MSSAVLHDNSKIVDLSFVNTSSETVSIVFKNESFNKFIDLTSTSERFNSKFLTSELLHHNNVHDADERNGKIMHNLNTNRNENYANCIEDFNDTKLDDGVINLIESQDMDLIISLSPADEVLNIFLDACKEFVNETLLKHGNNYLDVIQEFAENGYKKKQQYQNCSSNAIEIDFTSTSWLTTDEYRQEALQQLCDDYPILRKKSIQESFAKNQHHYYHTLKEIEKITGMEPCNLHSIKSRSISKVDINNLREKLTEYNQSHPQEETKLVVKSQTKRLRTSYITNEIFQKEIQFIKKQKAQELMEKDIKAAESLNELLATEDGTLIECGCCCCEYPIEKIVQCTEGHLFCKKCLQLYVEQRVFGEGRASQLACMHTGNEKCSGKFSDAMIESALPKKVYEKYQEAVATEVVKAAKIDDLISCYHCSIQVEMAESVGNILHCPVCFKDTCRLCKEEAHIPLKCHEVEKKTETSARLTVEEAMTQARLRQCHKCKARFYKTEGCNKMTCACGAYICYMCRQDISKDAYAHFCQVAHCDHKSCKKCKVYSDTIEDDRMAMLEAGEKTLLQLESENYGLTNDSSSSTLRNKIEIQKLLEVKANGSHQPNLLIPQQPNVFVPQQFPRHLMFPGIPFNGNQNNMFQQIPPIRWNPYQAFPPPYPANPPPYQAVLPLYPAVNVNVNPPDINAVPIRAIRVPLRRGTRPRRKAKRNEEE